MSTSSILLISYLTSSTFNIYTKREDLIFDEFEDNRSYVEVHLGGIRGVGLKHEFIELLNQLVFADPLSLLNFPQNRESFSDVHDAPVPELLEKLSQKVNRFALKNVFF